MTIILSSPVSFYLRLPLREILRVPYTEPYGGLDVDSVLGGVNFIFQN